MYAISQAGGKIKYGHSEVGYISNDDEEMEQNELEFAPVNVEDAADQLVIAKWMLRLIGQRYGVNISFAPKILVGHAGSGMHVHTRLMEGVRNMILLAGLHLNNLCCFMGPPHFAPPIAVIYAVLNPQDGFFYSSQEQKS